VGKKGGDYHAIMKTREARGTAAPARMAFRAWTTEKAPRSARARGNLILKPGSKFFMPIPFLACMVATAAFYHLPPRVLPAIHVVEGGRPGSISRNTDGSFDLGVMQVNTLWAPKIAAVTGMTDAAVRSRLTYDPCFGIAAAGAIMRVYLNESGGDLLRAVGDYHSHTPARAIAYQEKVLGAARRLFARQTPVMTAVTAANYP
jgi:hypothetical protein